AQVLRGRHGHEPLQRPLRELQDIPGQDSRAVRSDGRERGARRSRREQGDRGAAIGGPRPRDEADRREGDRRDGGGGVARVWQEIVTSSRTTTWRRSEGSIPRRRRRRGRPSKSRAASGGSTSTGTGCPTSRTSR